MRQRREEGRIHNRARMVVASYLTKTLDDRWQKGAHHFLYWLTEGDIPTNSGNWKWAAGTGMDMRADRSLSPDRQAARFDADGTYRRRHAAGPGARRGPVQLEMDGA